MITNKNMDIKTIKKVGVRRDNNGVIEMDITPSYGDFFILDVEFEDGTDGIARAKKEDPAWATAGSLVDVTTPGGDFKNTGKSFLKIQLPQKEGGGFSVNQGSATSTTFSKGRIPKSGEPSVDEKISTQASVNHASQVVMNDPYFKANGVTDTFAEDVYEVANKLKEVRDAIIEGRGLKDEFLSVRPPSGKSKPTVEESPF